MLGSFLFDMSCNKLLLICSQKVVFFFLCFFFFFFVYLHEDIFCRQSFKGLHQSTSLNYLEQELVRIIFSWEKIFVYLSGFPI